MLFLVSIKKRARFLLEEFENILNKAIIEFGFRRIFGLDVLINCILIIKKECNGLAKCENAKQRERLRKCNIQSKRLCSILMWRG